MYNGGVYRLWTNRMPFAPLPEIPVAWDHLIARVRFFRALPRPVAVVIACDLAALAPQDQVGRRAIDAAREWLLGDRGAAELPAIFQAALSGVSGVRRSPQSVSRFAAACTLGVAVAHYDAAVSAALAAGELSHYDNQRATYARQRRLVVEVMHLIEDATVRRLLRAAEDDPTARAAFWDALHDAGYTPLRAQSE